MDHPFQKGLKSGFPIFIGYVPPAVAFGILARTCEITLLESFLFSAVVFAGASQFIALNLLMAGAGTMGIIFTTLFVNFRHFLMSAYLATKMQNMSKKLLFLTAFGVTDETFSVLSFQKGDLSFRFTFPVQLAAYSGWVSGTISGYVMGSFLPELLSKSMGVALYSLLLAIIVPEMKKSLKTVLLVVISGGLNAVLVHLDFLPAGWSIIVCILVISFAGSFYLTDDSGQKGRETS